MSSTLRECIAGVLVYRARCSEARIQQMLWKVDYSDIVFVNTVCIALLYRDRFRLKSRYYRFHHLHRIRH